MSIALKSCCPGCRAALTIERPQERRIAPCPACGYQIKVPEELTGHGSEESFPSVVEQNDTACGSETPRDRPSRNSAGVNDDSAAIRSKKTIAGFLTGKTVASLLVGLALSGAGYFLATVRDADSQKTNDEASLDYKDGIDEQHVLDTIAELNAQASLLESEKSALEEDLAGMNHQLSRILNIDLQNLRDLQSVSYGAAK